MRSATKRKPNAGFPPSTNVKPPCMAVLSNFALNERACKFSNVPCNTVSTENRRNREVEISGGSAFSHLSNPRKSSDPALMRIFANGLPLDICSVPARPTEPLPGNNTLICSIKILPCARRTLAFACRKTPPLNFTTSAPKSTLKSRLAGSAVTAAGALSVTIFTDLDVTLTFALPVLVEPEGMARSSCRSPLRSKLETRNFSRLPRLPVRAILASPTPRTLPNCTANSVNAIDCCETATFATAFIVCLRIAGAA